MREFIDIISRVVAALSALMGSVLLVMIFLGYEITPNQIASMAALALVYGGSAYALRSERND